MKKPKKSTKKIQLDVYLQKTQSEINEKATSLILPITKETDIIKISEDIKPVVLVIFCDMFDGEHKKAIEGAALYKLSVLGIQAYENKLMAEMSPIDLNNIVGISQNILSLLPILSTGFSSILSCMGDKIKNDNNDMILQYGLAAHLGANIANASNKDNVREIGIIIGKISEKVNPEASYKQFKELIKQLPKNQYKKILEGLVNKIRKEEEVEEETTKKISTKKDYKENKNNDSKTETEVKFNITKD